MPPKLQFGEIQNPNRGKPAPTGKRKQETGLAKSVQHHNRPEYAEQTRIQSAIIMSGVPISRQEAKRQAKAEIRGKKK